MSKREKKTNLKSSILILLLLAILLIASTYAWFTSNRTVAVSQLDVNVVAKNGLQISADATNWKSLLQVADLTGANYTGIKNQIPSNYLEPVSSVGGLNDDGTMTMFYGTVDSESGVNLLTATKETDINAHEAGEGNGRYIAFDMYLQNDSAAAIPVHLLTSGSKVVDTDSSTKGLENAARVAFVNEGNVALGSQPSAAQALTTTETANVKIWEPNYTSHTTQGTENGFSLFGTRINDGSSVVTNAINKPITTGIELKDCTAANESFTAQTAAYQTTKTQAASVEWLSIPSGISKIRVYMWIEGQDIDCQNAASGANLGFTLQLSMDAETEPEP